MSANQSVWLTCRRCGERARSHAPRANSIGSISCGSVLQRPWRCPVCGTTGPCIVLRPARREAASKYACGIPLNRHDVLCGASLARFVQEGVSWDDFNGYQYRPDETRPAVTRQLFGHHGLA